MNSSSANSSVIVIAVSNRDSLTEALIKNLIVSALCISINYINGTLVHTFRKHQVLSSSPRYMLFIHLVINDMIQLYLSALLYILSYTIHTINTSVCIILLAVSITTTLNTPINLAGMAVECYIAICIPLRHGQICTIRNTNILIGVIWVAGALAILPDVFILVATEPMHFFYTKTFCMRDLVFRSSYSTRKRNISHILCLVLVWLILFYTYIRILFATKVTNMDNKKARNTILLHGFQLLLCMLTYVRPSISQVVQNLHAHVQRNVQFYTYIIAMILPRFFSPIVYGLRDHTFRKYARKYFICKARGKVRQENNTAQNVMPTT